MNDINRSIMNRRLPQVFGIFVLLFSLLAISYLSFNSVRVGTEAATGDVPKNMQVSNISDNTFTVSYITDESVSGSIAYGKDTKLGNVAFDIRDGSSPLPHKVHYITISGLSPSTKYFFTINSSDADSPKNVTHEISTASSSATNSKTQFTISGKVILADGNIPTEAIAYVQSNNSQLLSTLLNPAGGYIFNLNTIRSKDLLSFLTLAQNTSLNMTILNSSAQSKITFLANQADPIPPVTLSKDYDFSIDNEPLRTASASESAAVTGFPTPDASTTTQGPQILTPESAQEFKDQQPLFEGKALPQNDVEITIESDPIVSTVQTDQNGNWQFRPETKLEPGEHKITIKTLNASGILQTLTRSFTVYAEGSQFVEPSVSPTVPPTATATPIPTVQPTTIVTTIPTPIIVTTSPVISDTTATPVAQITTPPIPNAGSSSLLFGILGFGSIITIGSLLFFLL